MKGRAGSRIGLVGSSGGHLAQLLVLEPWWQRYDRFWVTFDKRDARAALGDERTYWCYYPTNRNPWNLFRNTVLAAHVLWKERPDLVVSSGAAVAVPFFFLAPFFGVRTIFIEVVDRVDKPTLTGRLVRRVASAVAVQWREQLVHYPGAQVIGRLL
jgi:UDP-N-acetylglucosamine:LPS N-acetylglucosamine transferase